MLMKAMSAASVNRGISNISAPGAAGPIRTSKDAGVEGLAEGVWLGAGEADSVIDEDMDGEIDGDDDVEVDGYGLSELVVLGEGEADTVIGERYVGHDLPDPEPAGSR